MAAASEASKHETCPDSQVLQQYLIGQLSDDEFEWVDSHITSCPSCADEVATSPRSADCLSSHLGQLPAEPDFGEYELLHRLGQGGMGRVFCARHRLLKQDFALKVIHPKLREDPQFAERFRREVQSLGQVDSPNVVRSVHAGVWHDAAFVVMELVDGGDLETAVRQFGALNPADSAEVIAQVVTGLGAIHEAGLVHRDLHPANVLLSRAGQVKIADFGLIRAAVDGDDFAGLTDARDRLGAEAFIPPEQRATPNNVTASADFFSLGCLWYFLLTGRVFPRDPLTHCVTRVEEALSSVPRRCRPLIRQLVTDDPESRLQSSHELLRSLSRIRRKAKLAGVWRDSDDSTIQRRASFDRRIAAFGSTVVVAAILGVIGWNSGDIQTAPESHYHELAPEFISVPYMQSGPFARATFFEAYPQPYTLELVDTDDAMLSNGRLVTFWYFDCVGDPEETLLSYMERSPRPSIVVDLIPGTHKVGIWSARNDVWEGEQRKVVDRATVIFYVYPDLKAGPLSLSTKHMQQGEDVVLSLEVENRGTVESAPGTVRTFLNADQASYVSGAVTDTALPALEPGENCQLQVRAQVPDDFPPGEAFFSVLVDALDTTNERDELPVGTWPEGKEKGFHFVTKKDPKGVPPDNNRAAVSVSVIGSS